MSASIKYDCFGIMIPTHISFLGADERAAGVSGNSSHCVGNVFSEIACGINILLLGSTCPVITEKTRPTGLAMGFQFAGAQTGDAKSIRYI
jgi:hypothetical protein